jgi:hypothetical protein
VDAILAAFDRHDVVAAGNPTSFYLDLIRNPDFPEKSVDIVIECGNSLHQPVLDAYLTGQDIPLSELRKVWRDTTQPSCGFSTFYEQLIRLVRRINDRREPAAKLRVLAGDPPIDWSQVNRPEDLDPFRDRDTNIASVIRSEVLSRGRKALLLFGIRHLRHGDEGNAVGMYESEYPGETFVIAIHHGFTQDNDRLEGQLGPWPSLTLIDGTWLGDLDSSYFGEPGGKAGYRGVDAYLYERPRHLQLREPLSTAVILDQEYLEELRRRAEAIQALPDMHPDAYLKREAEAGAFADEGSGGNPEPPHCRLQSDACTECVQVDHCGDPVSACGGDALCIAALDEFFTCGCSTQDAGGDPSPCLRRFAAASASAGALVSCVQQSCGSVCGL